MTSIKLQSIAEAENGSLFSICFEGDSISEFEKFVQEHNESYSKDLNTILTAIKRMLEVSGFLERYFQYNDNVCALPIDSGKLRLYCVRINDSILILGNGGVKKAQKYQDCDNLNGYVVTLQKLDKALKIAIKSGEVTIEERMFNHKDKDFEL
jgi:hypothetical protein